MRFARGGIALSVCLLALACAPDTGGQDSPRVADGESASALGSEREESAIFVLGSGHYDRYVYRGAFSESFWIDLSVRDDAHQKEVGVLWTLDGWQTQQTASASFEANLDDGREKWGIDVRDFVTRFSGQGTVEVEYAAYVRMNGQTHWSPYRNHYIYQDVSVASPLRLLDSHVELDAAGQPRLEGTVRALNIAGERKVFVRFTTDDWQHHREVEAHGNGKDFSFEAALAFDPERTERVAFAVRLDAQGEAHWLNNGGANFAHQLAPELADVHFQDDGLRPAAGIRVLSALARSDLMVQRAWIRIDNGARVALPEAPPFGALGVGGLSSGGVVSYAFSVDGLAAGEHALTLEVAAGPFVRRSAPLAFRVAHDIQWLSTWDVTAAEAAWDLTVRADGKLLLQRETRLETYEAFGATAPLEQITLPSGPRIDDVDTDESDRIIVLRDAHVTRLLSAGEVDVTFGDNGTLVLDEPYASIPLCYAANVAAFRDRVYVNDSCNSRVLQFDSAGVFLAATDLTVPGLSTNVTRTFETGDYLWVARDLYDGTLRHELVAVADASTFGVLDVKRLDPAIENLDAFALQGDDTWATSLWDNLHLVQSSSGNETARWTAGRWALPGAVHIGRSIVPLSDGSIAILSVDTGKVERFTAHR